jgi:hypothetical protein
MQPSEYPENKYVPAGGMLGEGDFAGAFFAEVVKATPTEEVTPEGERIRPPRNYRENFDTTQVQRLSLKPE